MRMDAVDDGQMSEDAWLVLRSMHYSPERETLATIMLGPLVLGAKRALKRLERRRS
jgi:hypothetical protein